MRERESRSILTVKWMGVLDTEAKRACNVRRDLECRTRERELGIDINNDLELVFQVLKFILVAIGMSLRT